ncbi:MAG: hypothetical protein U0984_05885 [Prosthecobacter sp.]|nr:hypothetical protein [Prosthecobacter sp.]
MGKIVVFGILCMVLIGIMYGVHHTTAIDEATRALEEAKREVGLMEGAVKYQQNVTAWRKELAAMIAAADILTRDHGVIRAEIRGLEQAETRAADSFVRSVEKVREETVGLVMDEMPLKNGLVLKRVRIQNLDRTEMSVMHSEGISKVLLEDLPDNLKERLRIGMNFVASGSNGSGANRVDSSVSDRIAEMGRFREEAPDKKDEKKVKVKSNPKTDGDPALWNSVTRKSLNRAFIPGQGWLEVGTLGPIPGSGK